jgi:hypothetical protein
MRICTAMDMMMAVPAKKLSPRLGFGRGIWYARVWKILEAVKTLKCIRAAEAVGPVKTYTKPNKTNGMMFSMSLR